MKTTTSTPGMSTPGMSTPQKTPRVFAGPAWAAALSLAVALGGCGTTPEERGVSGAGLGAAGGAVVGAVTGLSVASGALIGAGIGGATGLFTDKDQVDLGDPVWKRKARAGGGGTTTVADVQRNLAAAGYDPGPADGIAGPKTRDAIRRYQRDHDLLVDGDPSPELAAHIRQNL